MLSNVFLKSLRDQRRSMVWWVIGMVLLTLITVLFYPSIKDLPDLNDLLGDSDSITRVFVGDIEDLTSPEGFLNSQLYFLLVPLVFLVFAVALGSGAIAGEERKGTLDLLLSYPLTRRSVLLQKFASMALATIALAFVVWLAVIIGAALVSMELSLLRAGEATFSAATWRCEGVDRRIRFFVRQPAFGSGPLAVDSG